MVIGNKKGGVAIFEECGLFSLKNNTSILVSLRWLVSNMSVR